ncbi:alpha/beta hydrolase [Fimbriiglobus ruber]|uniref:Alpha/beta hydrolase n=1 Tax=Fimbriiglobus ruber TaxID=1908690 RepID=A0A225DJR5_9BACT|nr:alpha/beta hydrolase [Fimbriiglobus ruber]OWK36635.1 alpha/beta hydrolase [Fimbriiglobus ruber]
MFRLTTTAAWLSTLFALIPPVARAADPPPPGPVTRFDVTYATAGDEKLKLDFAAPPGPGPFPCVVCLHGGAWKMGSRKDLSRPIPWAEFGPGNKSLIETLAGHGYAAASVSYRFAPKSKFPAQIEDAKTAVRFLRANAKEFHIDPDRIGALGFSSGGHLAALLGTTDKSAGFDGPLYPDQSSRVSCVVDFFGPADLSLFGDTPGIEAMFLVPLMGGTAASKSDLYKKASPLDRVSKNSVPFLILQGTADIVVPAVHSERLHDKLTAAGVKSELILLKGKGHGWGGVDAVQSSDAMFKFLDEYLKGK